MVDRDTLSQGVRGADRELRRRLSTATEEQNENISRTRGVIRPPGRHREISGRSTEPPTELRPLDTALHRLMVGLKSLAHCAERRILPIRQQHLRPRHPARQLSSRARKHRQGRNLFITHCQFDRSPPSCHDTAPFVPPIQPDPPRRFHGIDRLVHAQFAAWAIERALSHRT
jgi:hypothetical protein